MKKENKNNKKTKIDIKKKNNMFSKFFNKYATIIYSLLIVVVFTVVMGASYAFFTTVVKGKDFVIYTGTLAVNYKKKTDVINVDNLYPMTDTEGLNQTPHEFTITNDGNINARYQVRLELDNSINDMIPIEYIKLSYSIDGSSYSDPILLSDLDSSLAFIRNVQLKPTKSNTIGIKLWIDLNAPNEVQGKVFKTKVVVDSIQDVDDGYVVDTAPIIYLNKDENGNQDMIINTNGTYTELGVNRVLDDKQVFATNQVTKTYEYYDGTNTTTVDNIDTSKTGIYYVTYSITDSDNNIGKAVRVVAVGDEESLNIYHNIDAVVSSFNQSSLKEVIMCSYIDGNDRMYFDCKIHDTIENALASKTKGVIIATSDINRNSTITINSDKEIVLELNRKNVSLTGINSVLNQGVLYVNQFGNPGTIIGYSRAIVTYGTTNIYNGYFSNTIEENDGASTVFVANGGTLNVYGDKVTLDENGNYVSGTYIKGNGNSAINMQLGTVNVYNGTIETIGTMATIRSNYNATSIINIYDGEIIGNQHGIGLDVNCSSTTEINVYGGRIIANNYWAIYNDSEGTINLYAGSFISNSNSAILNRSTGTININQINKPLYTTSFATTTLRPAVSNNSIGIINISGKEADNCTNNSEDTNAGLCIYAEGDKNYETSTSNAAVSNAGDGIININGGTMFGGYIGVYNYYNGIINITGGYIQSGKYGIDNIRTGNINICSAKINSLQYDIWSASSSTGLINYSSNVIFTSGDNTPVTGGVTANIVPNYSGTCVSE